MSSSNVALESAAWAVRENARILGSTSVGCALMTSTGDVFTGCNVEHQYRSHDIHAETNAISTMVAAGHRSLVAIFVVAERSRFTPCGSCMDWIFEFGGPDCTVSWQRCPGGQISSFKASELMPYYPR